MNKRGHNSIRNASICVMGGILIGAILILNIYQSPNSMTHEDREKRALTIGEKELQVEVAQTREQRIQGLSGRAALPEGKGMLFIFEEEGEQAIWMKDMHFPIDIVWINKKGTVVHIADTVTPETYPATFTSPTPAKYVLEVPAGYARENILLGDSITMTELRKE